jgi:hypothetical protein
MSGFLYFKPGASAVSIESVKEWGLGYAFDTRVAGTKCQGGTPTGAAGIVFADKQRMGEQPIRMDLANQVWGKIPGTDLHVGYWKDAPPTPDCLARGKQLPGLTVRLANDREWTIPLVRRFDRDSSELVSALPCYMTCGDDGNWVRGQVVDIHAHLWDLVTPFAQDILHQYDEDGDKQPRIFSDTEICNTVTTLLQTNYVVGPGELSVIRAYAEEAATHGAILAACDFLTFLSWFEDQKKSELAQTEDGSTIAAGNAA